MQERIQLHLYQTKTLCRHFVTVCLCYLKEFKKSYPSLTFAWAQIAEGKNNDQELLQSQVGQE